MKNLFNKVTQVPITNYSKDVGGVSSSTESGSQWRNQQDTITVNGNGSKIQTIPTRDGLGVEKEMTVMYLSANPGDPSILWRSESGEWYRTKQEALKGEGTPIDPDEVEIQHSWFERNPKLVAFLVISVIAGVVFFLIRTKKIVL